MEQKEDDINVLEIDITGNLNIGQMVIIKYKGNVLARFSGEQDPTSSVERIKLIQMGY